MIRPLYLIIILSLTSVILAASQSTLSVSRATSSITTWPYQIFKTQPSFFPPIMQYEKTDQATPGYFFMSPQGSGARDAAVLIMTDTNDLIWQLPSHSSTGSSSSYNNGSANANTTTAHLQLATLEGEQVLVYWEGVLPPGLGRGYGSVHILDSSYRQLHHITLDFPRAAEDESTYTSYIDAHEAHLTSRGSVLVTVFNATMLDLRSVGGLEEGWILDSLIFEIDVVTNEVLWSWSSVEHLDQIPLSLSMVKNPGDGESFDSAWNWFHANSIVEYGKGVIVSARNVCSILYIDKSTGDVIWNVRGPDGGDFVLDDNARFCFQHDAQIAPNSPSELIVTLHNNNNSVAGQTNLTTGLTLSLNLKSMTATTVNRLYDSASLVHSSSQGNMQILPSSNTLLNHGNWPAIFEYDVHGNVVYKAVYGEILDVASYRVYRHKFVGRPVTSPDVVACRTTRSTSKLYMSWNGATEYVVWRISGCQNGPLRVPKRSFETVVELDCRGNVKLEALSPNGDSLGVTSVNIEEESLCEYLD